MLLGWMKKNTALDRSQGAKMADHERRIAALERQIQERVKTLDADG